MITSKDLAPLDCESLENWRNDLKHLKDETLRDLYIFSRNFYAFSCLNHYNGEICSGCKNLDFCKSCKLTTVVVWHELSERSV